ncbi:hypothetical protein Btru_062456 [Bulinus truncatus]|nr:hypothetical protein Btru_062456 [Bulinus truncatus]
MQSVGNIGVYVNKYYNSLQEDGKKVTTLLLSIVKNQNMSVSIARAAVQALANTGLNEMIASELFNVLSEEWRPLVLRASVFDELLLQGNELIMMKLVNLLKNTSVENLRTYIVTKVRSSNERPEQNFDHWRQKLNKLVEGLQLDQEENIWSKSQFTKLSHTVLIPLTSMQLGGHLALNILYTPTSSLFHSLTIKADLKIGDKMWKILEIVIDIEGMDDVVHLFTSKLKNNTDISNIIKEVMTLLQHKVQQKEKKSTFHFTHFSNTIAQAIQNIASTANFQMTSFPKAYIFLRLNGYDVGWISLKSILGTLSQLRNSDNLFQGVMKTLIQRTDKFLLNAVKLFDSHKIIPTISGYPLDINLDAAIVAKLYHDIKDHPKTKNLALDVVFQPSISAYLQASMQVSVEGYSKSRIALKLSGLTNLDMLTNVQHHSVNTQKYKEHFFSLSWKSGSEQFKFFGLKSDLYLLHNDLEQKILPPEPKMNVLKCLPEIYNLVSGTELSRVINISLNMDRHVGFKLECSIPDANVVYLLQHKNFMNATHHHHIYASVLQQESKTLHALAYESKGYSIPMVASLFKDMSIPYNYTDSVIHLTIALSSLSLDLRSKKRVHTATYATNDIIIKYYCEPKLKLLYAFHPVPRLAAKQEHTSIFSYHQETSDTKIPLEKTWKAFYKFVLIWPDQKIFTTTEMIANLKAADRVTHLTWEYGSEVDEIHMTSHVNNMSMPDYALLDYSLSLNNIGKFAIDLKGNASIKGKLPWLNATMKTDVMFMKKGLCIKKFKKSEQSGSCQVSSELNKKTLILYDEIQIRILQWLQGCDKQSSSLNICQKWLEKERFSLWWKGCNLPDNEESCRAAKGNATNISQKNSFLNLANWTYGFNGNLKLNPHRMHSVAGPEGGLLLQWMTNSTWPKADEPFLETNGSLYMGRKHWVKLDMNDYLHSVKFNLKGEHLETPMVFQHDHSWTITETSQHSLDRSFKIHIDFEHYKLFDYGLILCSPRTNITHRINYSKISEQNHTIRASALIYSVQPEFRLNYVESTDIIGQNAATHIKMMNTLFNYELNLKKKSDVHGMIMTGNLSTDGWILGTEGKTIFSTSLILQKNRLPQWNLTYMFDNFSGISVGVMLRNPKAIRLSLNLLNVDKSEKKYENMISLTSELRGPKVLLHKFELSSLIAKIIQQKLHMLQQNISESISHTGKVLAQNIKAQLKDIVWPLLNETMSEYFRRKNIPEMVVNITNNIWLDLPLVQAIKLFHIDETLANAIQLSSQLVSHWILHPPFFINNFIKVHLYPNVLVALNENSLNYSQHLFVNMPTFLQLPKMPVDEKKLLAFIKHKTMSPHLKEKDIAVIIDGKRIKTFDGVIYDITEPPADLCTYLMSCDFKHGHFSLTYTKSGLTLSLQKFGLTITKEGSVVPFGKVKIDSLPYYSKDGHLFFDFFDGEFHLDVALGSVHLIFNPLQQFYILAIDKHLKNATLGLLGTNNFEKGDDFLLPSGVVQKNSIDFQNGYELSNSSQCHISVPPGFISCMTSSDQACSLFSHPDLEMCSTLINPQFFKLQCQVDICHNQSVCRSVSAYAAACLSQGMKADLPSHCLHQCGDDSGLDIVVVQSLHKKLLKAHDPLHAVRHLLANFESDISFGFVTYGGTGNWKNPKAHLLNGKLLEKSVKVLLNIPINISTTDSETFAEDAVIAAANFPFQVKHSKIILLIYPHAAAKNGTKPSLVKFLQSRGITLVATSVYQEFEEKELEEKQIIGLLTDGKTIGNSHNVTKPQDVFTGIVQDTRGMWINLDVLTAGQQANIRKIVYELTKLNKNCNDALISAGGHQVTSGSKPMP